MAWKQILKSERFATIKGMKNNVRVAKERLQKKYLPQKDYDMALSKIQSLEQDIEYLTKPREFRLPGEAKYIEDRFVDDIYDRFQETLEEFYQIFYDY